MAENDKIDRRVQCLVDGQLTHKPVIELQPIVYPFGQPLVVDNNQPVEVLAISFGGMRFVKTSARC